MSARTVADISDADLLRRAVGICSQRAISSRSSRAHRRRLQSACAAACMLDLARDSRTAALHDLRAIAKRLEKRNEQ